MVRIIWRPWNAEGRGYHRIRGGVSRVLKRIILAYLVFSRSTQSLTAGRYITVPSGDRRSSFCALFRFRVVSFIGRGCLTGPSTMRWFGKRKQNDLWDNDLEKPIGDLAAAHRIRKICEAAADIATNIRSHPSRREKERCERATKTAMQIAIKISDDLVRDAALRQIGRGEERTNVGNGGISLERLCSCAGAVRAVAQRCSSPVRKRLLRDCRCVDRIRV